MNKIKKWRKFDDPNPVAKHVKVPADWYAMKCVLGGFDNRPSGVLYAGTKAEVQAEARRLVAEAGMLGVMLGADCTLPATVDIRRFGWVVEAVQALG